MAAMDDDALIELVATHRVVAFYGCSTNSYDTALRNTAGFGIREADVLVTNRTMRVDEARFSTHPWQRTGTRDNPGR